MPATPTPSTIASQCYALALRRAGRRISRRYDEVLAPLGLNNGQFSMLTSIAGLEPVSMQALADHLAMDRTTVTAALKPLQRRLLVEVRVAESDPRARAIRLGHAGRSLLENAIPLWQAAQEALTAELSRAGPGSDLRSLLARLA